MSAVITLYRQLGNPLPAAEWDFNLRYEVARILNDAAVVPSSVCLRRLLEDEVAILFVLKIDRISDPARNDILDDEPVALVYRSETVGSVAPGVFIDRVNFPRDLPHLNPVPNTSPASICLAREGLQALYDLVGVGGIIDRLRRWLRDAKTDSLNRDGWEPVPAAADAKVGFIDGANFQNFAATNGDNPGWAWGIAMYAGNAEVFYLPHQALTLEIHGQPLPVKNLASKAKPAIDNRLFREVTPLFYLWQKTSAAEMKPIFSHYDVLGELYDDLRQLSLHLKFDTAFKDVHEINWDRRSPLPWTAVLLVGVRRPQPIISDRFGLALDQGTRRLELKAFRIQASSKKGLRDKNAQICEVALMPTVSSGLLADVSGIQSNRGVCIVGYGALGSTMADFFARMGVEDISTIDDDVFLAHNLARHNATRLCLGLRKANTIKHLELVTRAPGERPFRGYPEDVLKLSTANLAQCLDTASLVVDATASDRVRRTLPLKLQQLDCRIVRTELFDEGRLGVLSVQGKNGNPDLLDLYYTLCQLGTENEIVATWLRNESGRKYDPSTVVAGFSCASATLRMPYWKIASHAGAFMSQVSELISGKDLEAGIGLNPLVDRGFPRGWQWLNVKPFEFHYPVVDPEWQIRVAPHVPVCMRAMSAERFPKETGGYLYGGWDLRLKRITITAVTPEPPGTAASAAALRLGRAGKTREEQQIKRNCGGRIDLVGTWHSHPNGSSEMSNRDQQTLALFQRVNEKRGLPTLLLICGATEIRAHLEL